MAEVTAVYDALPAPRAAEDIIIGGRRCRLEPQVPERFFALAVADDGHCVCD